MNHYYAKLFSVAGESRWNVIQVNGDSASHYIFPMNYDLHQDTPAVMTVIVTVGRIEEDEDGLWYTDGEDYEFISDWEKHDGNLIEKEEGTHG